MLLHVGSRIIVVDFPSGPFSRWESYYLLFDFGACFSTSGIVLFAFHLSGVYYIALEIILFSYVFDYSGVYFVALVVVLLVFWISI